MPEPEFASDQDKIKLAEFYTAALWKGLKLEVSCMHDGEFAALLFMPAELGEPHVMPRVLRSLVVLANQEADALDAQERGMRQAVDPELANIYVADPKDMTPLEDAFFRVGLVPVRVTDPSCVIFFSADWQVTGWTLRTFARLAAEQASMIEGAYPSDPREARPKAPEGPRRAPVFNEERSKDVPDLRQRQQAPPPVYEPDPEDMPELEPVGMADEPVLPPAEVRQRSQGLQGQARRGPAIRRGPLSMGVPGAGGEPAKVPDPVQPRIHSKRQQP